MFRAVFSSLIHMPANERLAGWLVRLDVGHHKSLLRLMLSYLSFNQGSERKTAWIIIIITAMHSVFGWLFVLFLYSFRQNLVSFFSSTTTMRCCLIVVVLVVLYSLNSFSKFKLRLEIILVSWLVHLMYVVFTKTNEKFHI